MKKLFKNGTVYTMNHSEDTYAGVIVDNGIIEAVLSQEDLKGINQNNFEVIDLNGGTMLPGFVETHIHVMGTGVWLSSVILNGETNIENVKEKIKQKAKTLEAGEWLVAEGYDENLLNGIRLDKSDLDELCKDHPVIIKRVCRHAAIVNSKALEVINIQDDVENPDGGSYEKRNGQLTGWVYDTAMEPFEELASNEDEQSLTKHLERAIDYLYQFGITGSHTEDLGYYEDYKDVLNAYKTVVGDKDNQRPFRVRLLRHFSVYEQMMDEQATFVDGWLEPDAMKFYADGAFGGSTALMKESYSNDPTGENYGLAIYTQEALNEKVKLARNYDGAIAVHMIGDKACEMVLDAIEKYPAPKGLRDRLIHISTLNETLLNRVSKLPVICDVQPQFITSDFPWVQEKVGNERARYLYPFKSMLDLGIIIGGGSDAPIETPNPMLGVHAAVNRQSYGEDGAYFIEEALSIFDAISLYTTQASEIAQTTDRTGKIKSGYEADFTVLDKDPFKTNPKELANIQATKTIVNGKIVYERV
ncbi:MULTISPECIES: amidohydrolase [Mammaliicoccus]|uniref:Amidohydrolase n=1 Tax=Mammaliicoccus vitulinus TaxID=71237 RepID=A0A2T4PQL0_9STAP|nr:MULTISPECIES: amidohydrolase [Mammaliicoccus]PTI28046.1 amidohydrolase [Mammaliicoccus vitulinus]PTI36474.1 amidohydrolase [Mammaliicoccus vitulinus]RIN22991.1 amidohydrolase [Mammaliicoccus vitulinus]